MFLSISPLNQLVKFRKDLLDLFTTITAEVVYKKLELRSTEWFVVKISFANH